MNTWNLKQVIVLEGEIPITIRLRQIVDKIKASDLIPKVYLYEYDPTQLAGSDPRIKVLKIFDQEQEQLTPEQNEIMEKTKDLQDKLVSNNKDFDGYLKKMPVSLKFSFMALLSARKTSVFSRDIFELLDYVFKQLPRTV